MTKVKVAKKFKVIFQALDCVLILEMYTFCSCENIIWSSLLVSLVAAFKIWSKDKGDWYW